MTNVDYWNDGEVGWQGLFTQLEYDKDNLLDLFLLLFQIHLIRRIDYFNYLDSDPLQETDKYNFAGYSVKGGANYNIND